MIFRSSSSHWQHEHQDCCTAGIRGAHTPLNKVSSSGQPGMSMIPLSHVMLDLQSTLSASPQALLLAGVGMQVTHVAIQERAQMPQCCQHKAAVKEKKNLGFPFFSFLQHSCFTSPCSCSFCSGTSCDCLCFPGSLLAQREWRTCLLRDGTGSCRCSFPPRTHPLLLKIWL